MVDEIIQFKNVTVVLLALLSKGVPLGATISDSFKMDDARKI